MTGPECVVARARDMIGVRWRHQGRKAWAVDCIGLVELALLHAAWPGAVYRPACYGREPWDDQLRAGMRQHFGEPITDAWSPGDVPLFRWNEGEPSHVGILGNYLYGGVSIIHASSVRKQVIETGLSGRLLNCVIEVYRPKWGEA